MSELRDSLRKQRELERTYMDSRDEESALRAQERKALRKRRSQNELIEGILSAGDAIGKIAAGKSGGLVSGDLIPKVDLSKHGTDSISDEYDTKREELSSKSRSLREQIQDVEDERRIASDEETRARRKKAEEDRLKREAKRIEKEEKRLTEKAKKEALKKKKAAAKIEKAAKKQSEKLIKHELIADVKNDVIDGDEAMEEMIENAEEMGVDPAILEGFRETIKPILMNEDEELQAKTLTELQQKLRTHFIKQKVMEDLEMGIGEFDDSFLEKIGVSRPEDSLTKEPESAKVKESAPKEAPAGEPEKLQYKIVDTETGTEKPALYTLEEAMDVQEKLQASKGRFVLKRIKKSK